eukprot:gene57520-78806_t
MRSNIEIYRIGKCAFSTVQVSPMLSSVASTLRGSGIRDIMLRASELQKTHEIVHLEVGQPNFSTPVHIIESTIAALNQKKTAYIPNAGSTELRQVVSDRYGQRGIQTNASQIIITSGSMLAMFSLCL